MGERIFTLQDQRKFADLSGDTNPLHLDALIARRQIFGGIIVHGINSLLWTLDDYFTNLKAKLSIETLDADFLKPIVLEQKVECRTRNINLNGVEFLLIQNGVVMSVIIVRWSASQLPENLEPPNLLPEKREPLVRTLKELNNLSGNLPLCLYKPLAEELFPALSKALPPAELASILATTKLVGVECPGYYALYSSLRLTKGKTDLQSCALTYRLKTIDFRFSLLSIDVVSPVFSGEIKAFVRPKMVEQDDFAKIVSLVKKNEFSGQRALVVGGSRGLGLVAANILAGGSADVILTYNTGKNDAVNATESINLNKGSAGYIHMNVLNNDWPELRKLLETWKPTHLYYFATPFIFPAVKADFSPNYFDNFCEYYVKGFLKIVRALPKEDLRGILYPSTTAIDENPKNMGEYAAAKVAGEQLCNFLVKNSNEIVIHKPRLPRLATDQTVSLAPVSNGDPVPILMKEIRWLSKTLRYNPSS